MDLIDIDAIDRETVMKFIQTTGQVKSEPGRFEDRMENRTLLMLFEKPSTRTRVSFEAGMTRLGGHAINFETAQSQMSRGESLGDTGTVLGRYADLIIARMYEHAKLEELAAAAAVPVINGLTDLLHPCQAISDMFTIQEHGYSFQDAQLAYVGDGNNMAHSLMQASAAVGMDCTVATPEGYGPDADVLGRARVRGDRNNARIRSVRDPEEAVEGADIVYTDVWASMGDEAGGDAAASGSTRSGGSVRDENEKQRRTDLRPYQVNEDLMALADKDAVFMHCLPAHRGEEVSATVLDGPRSIVYDQAENRMHTQNAIMLELLG